MRNITKERRWKELCTVCNKMHIMHMSTCLSCGVYAVVQPVSENVCHNVNYECDGCEAYRDHLS